MSNLNMPDGPTVRPLVRLVDDDVEFLRSQKFFLETFLPVVRTWESAETFLAEDDLTRPGCLVLDIRMSGMSGLELQRLLEMRRSTLRIIFLSAHGDIGTAVHAMRHGALDFLEKPVEPEVLLEKVQQAVDASMNDFSHEREIHQIETRLLNLTGREREVLNLAIKGFQNKEIAEKLGISVTTVKMYRSNAFLKLDVNSPLAAANLLHKLPSPQGSLK